MSIAKDAAQHAKDADAAWCSPSPEEREKQEWRAKVSVELVQLMPTADILQFFQFTHLRPDLGDISMIFAGAAVGLVKLLPHNAERTVALRKLLEAKDAAVRARLYT